MFVWHPGPPGNKGSVVSCLGDRPGLGALGTWVPSLVPPCLGAPHLPGHADSVSPPAPQLSRPLARAAIMRREVWDLCGGAALLSGPRAASRGPKGESGPQTGCEMGTAWSIPGRQPTCGGDGPQSRARNSLTGGSHPGARGQGPRVSEGCCGARMWLARGGKLWASAQQEEEGV